MGCVMNKMRMSLMMGIVLSVMCISGCGKNDTNNIKATNETITKEIIKETTTEKNKSTTPTLTRDDKYPDYYRQEVLDTINTVQNKITGESISYIFITDLHLDSNNNEAIRTAAIRQLNAVVDVANNTDIDFVCVGGDLHDGKDAGEDGKKISIENVELVSKTLEGCNKPVFILKGNHDDNSFSAQIDGNLLFDPKHILTNEEWYNATMAHFSQYATDYHNGYFYYDLPDKNVRVVCLNMSDSDDGTTNGLRNEIGMYFYGYKDAQIQWLLDSALSRTDCQYVILNHDGFLYPEGYNESSNREVLSGIIAAFYTHTVYEDTKFKKDFTKYTGKPVLYHCGHMHMNRLVLDSRLGGLPSINTVCSKYQKSSVKNTGWANRFPGEGFYVDPGRETNTSTEAAFDVVISTPLAIDIVRFGGGDDRYLSLK